MLYQLAVLLRYLATPGYGRPYGHLPYNLHQLRKIREHFLRGSLVRSTSMLGYAVFGFRLHPSKDVASPVTTRLNEPIHSRLV
jgi:hypothetical protein